MSFMDGFAKYVGIQGILAVVTTCAVIAMAVLRYTIPPELWSLQGISWGFYFAKNGYSIANIGKRVE